MTKYNSLFLLFFLLLSSSYQACGQKGINRRQVRRVIKNLSDDEMNGRQAGTEDARRAADYISDYFEDLDLKPLNGDQDFLQEFEVFQTVPDRAQLKINDHEIPADEFFMISKNQQVNWQNTSQIEHIHISGEDEFRLRFRDAMNMKEDAFITVSGKHEQLFNRYANYFKQGSKSLEKGGGATKVFALSNEISLNNIDFNANQRLESIKMANVAGMIPGKTRPDEYVIFSAHYDHIGILNPVDGDSIANGADDDASGTTAVMLLARHYSKIEENERTIIFVAFTAEEMGGYGSQYFSKQLEPEKIAAMFNIEMIGKEAKFGPKTAYITGFDKSDFALILRKDLAGTDFHFYPDPYPSQNLFYRSDNATLARLGVPAHTISTVQIDQDKTYHTVNDEYDQLDVKNMTRIIKAIALSSKSIVNAEASPQRIKDEI